MAVSLSDLLSWADRAAADLREYAESAEASGTPQIATESLLRELNDIKRGRSQWTRAPGMNSGTDDAPGLAALQRQRLKRARHYDTGDKHRR
jgi:hypothetical protein